MIGIGISLAGVALVYLCGYVLHKMEQNFKFKWWSAPTFLLALLLMAISFLSIIGGILYSFGLFDK